MSRGKTTRRLLQFGLLLAVVAAVAYALWPQPVPADFGRVVRGPLDVVVEEEGKTRIRERYIVSAPLAGRMQRITLKAGDPVEAGKTLLATIEPGDPALLDTRALAEADAKVKAAAATLEQTGPQLEQAASGLGFAQSQHKRVRQQIERNVSTQEDLERRRDAGALASRRTARPNSLNRSLSSNSNWLRRPFPGKSPAATPSRRNGRSTFTRRSMAGCCGCCTKARASSLRRQSCWSWEIRPTWRSRSMCFRVMP